MIDPTAGRYLALALAALMAMPPGFSQSSQGQAPTAAQLSVPSPLKIQILEGDNSVNSIALKQAVIPVIEVRDANEFPVEGATVVFTLPPSGPGGFFPGNRADLTTRSDAQGQASAPF